MSSPKVPGTLGYTLRYLVPYVFVLSGCLALAPSSEHEAIPHFHTVNEQLYRGGRPENQGWEHLKNLEIRTVISLEEKDPSRARQQAESLGIKFHSIPVSLYERPADEKVIQFLRLVLDPDQQPVFVYCEDGKDRTGAMVAVYRVTVDGLGPKAAYQEAKHYGFWPYRGDAELKKFIHQLNDKKIFFEKAKAFQGGE